MAIPVQSQYNSSDETFERPSIGTILIQEKLITQEQYQRLKIEAAKQNTELDKLIHDLNIVPEEKYYEAQAKLLYSLGG